MHKELHKKLYTSAFSTTCQGAAAINSDLPLLSLTRHGTGAVMVLCKLILSCLSHQLQWEWREASFLVEMGEPHAEWWLQRKRGKPSLRFEDCGKRTNFGLPFPPWLDFTVASRAMELAVRCVLPLHTSAGCEMSGSWRTIHHMSWGWTTQDVFGSVYVHIYLWNCNCHCKHTSVCVFISLEHYT